MPHARSLVVAILVAFSAVHAAAEPAVVASSNLNLRSGPGPAFPVLVVMPRGTRLDIQKCTAEWCRVKAGRSVGYTSRALIQTGQESYASVAPEIAPEAAPQPASAGPRIWRWRDSEWRNKHWRQFGWRNRMKRH